MNVFDVYALMVYRYLPGFIAWSTEGSWAVMAGWLAISFRIRAFQQRDVYDVESLKFFPISNKLPMFCSSLTLSFFSAPDQRLSEECSHHVAVPVSPSAVSSNEWVEQRTLHVKKSSMISGWQQCCRPWSRVWTSPWSANERAPSRLGHSLEQASNKMYFI